VTDDRVNQVETGDTTSLSLLTRARASDEVAWGRIRSLYVPLVYQWCRQGGIRADDVPDIGQEVFVAVARNLHGFCRDQVGQTFRGWLRTITRNKVIDYHRAQKGKLAAFGGSDAQRQFDQVAFDSPAADGELSSVEEVSLLLDRAVEILASEFPDWYRTAFLRVVVDEQNPAEVAAELGKRVSAIYTAKSRILQRLRAEFAELTE